MLPCEEIERRLPQYIADGEPLTGRAAGLAQHLRCCPSCAAQAQRYRWVEEALQSYPIVAMDPSLTRRILDAMAAVDRMRERWNPLPWNVWLPLLTFMLALLVIAISLPNQLVSITLVEDMEHGLVNWSVPVSTWLTSLHLEISTDSFWALWLGVFATTAGIGIALSLTRWSRLNSRSLDALEAQVSAIVDRLLHHP